MKRFEELYHELKTKLEADDQSSQSVASIRKGCHFIGKKLVEEAAESWMAAEHEGKERTAEELSQLLYHVQLMMLASDITLEQIYEYL